jgi:hypothetical protein
VDAREADVVKGGQVVEVIEVRRSRCHLDQLDDPDDLDHLCLTHPSRRAVSASATIFHPALVLSS